MQFEEQGLLRQTRGLPARPPLSDLASLRGRVQHYSACLPHVLPYVDLISSVIGTEDDPDDDRAVQLPPAIPEAAVTCIPLGLRMDGRAFSAPAASSRILKTRGYPLTIVNPLKKTY